METIDVIKSRVSIRKYKNLPVSREILEDIADCGRLAPSGYNHQPYVFIFITDQQIRERIAKAAVYGRFISDAGACAAIFCRKGEETMMEDACAAAENMIIAAQAHGLGTCWVNSYKKDLSSDVKMILGCPDEYELMVLIAIGYPDEIRHTQKKPLEEVLRWNKFS